MTPQTNNLRPLEANEFDYASKTFQEYTELRKQGFKPVSTIDGQTYAEENTETVPEFRDLNSLEFDAKAVTTQEEYRAFRAAGRKPVQTEGGRIRIRN